MTSFVATGVTDPRVTNDHKGVTGSHPAMFFRRQLAKPLPMGSAVPSSALAGTRW